VLLTASQYLENFSDDTGDVNEHSFLKIIYNVSVFEDLHNSLYKYFPSDQVRDVTKSCMHKKSFLSSS